MLYKDFFNAGSWLHLSNAFSMWASSSNGILDNSRVMLEPSAVPFGIVAVFSNLMMRSRVPFWFSTKVTSTFETSTDTGT